MMGFMVAVAMSIPAWLAATRQFSTPSNPLRQCFSCTTKVLAIAKLDVPRL
jgi:hypothetical protein